MESIVWIAGVPQVIGSVSNQSQYWHFSISWYQLVSGIQYQFIATCAICDNALLTKLFEEQAESSVVKDLLSIELLC